MKLDLRGVKGVEAALFELKSVTAKSVGRRVLKAAGQPVADQANNEAPENEGGLSESYVVSSKLNKNQPKYGTAGGDEVHVHVGSNDPAAVQQEFGNVNHPAQPHFRPSWSAGSDGVLRDVSQSMGQEVAKSVDRARRKAARNQG